MTLLVLTILVSLPQIPSLILQGKDSGIFAYTGQVILHGGLPYRDAWDNKTPGVYYLNALAFVCFGENLWALWFAQIICVWFTGLVFWRLLLARSYNDLVALAGTAMLVFLARHAVPTGRGNFTETYALLPQVVCLFAGFRFLQKPGPGWGLVIGIAAGLVLLIRQNAVGLALVFPVAVLLARPPFLSTPRRWIGGILMMIAGGCSLLGLVAAYLARYGVLDEAIDAVFISPMQFHDWVSREHVSIWETMLGTLVSEPVWISMGPLIPLALMGWFLLTREGITHHTLTRHDTVRHVRRSQRGVPLGRIRHTARSVWAYALGLLPWTTMRLVHQTRQPVLARTGTGGKPRYSFSMVRSGASPDHRSAAVATFGLWAALTFVMDMGLANLSNRGGSIGFGHYYLTPIPAFVLLVLTALERVISSERVKPRVKRAVLIYSGLGTALWLPIALIYLIIVSPGTLFGPARPHPMADYVIEHTAPTDRVLAWGASSKLNFQTGRRSPTRFHYGYYLVVPGEPAQRKIAELVRDLETAKPVLIVDAAIDDGKHVPPLDPIQRKDWEAMGGRQDIADLTPIYDFVARHCVKAERFGNEFQIYRCTYSNESPQQKPTIHYYPAAARCPASHPVENAA